VRVQIILCWIAFAAFAVPGGVMVAYVVRDPDSHFLFPIPAMVVATGIHISDLRETPPAGAERTAVDDRAARLNDLPQWDVHAQCPAPTSTTLSSFHLSGHDDCAIGS